MNIGIFYIDFSVFQGMTAPQAAWFVFTQGGWIPFVWVLLIFLRDTWLANRQEKFLSGVEYIFLAIDVPADNEQMPKAVEQIFATLSGAQTSFLAAEKWWEGKVQLYFSFEIVSIDGYLQFIIRCPKINRELMESAIFSQYPQAEITEVEDYAKDMPTRYPDEKYNVWGTELALTKKEHFPIRTYIEFEEKLMGELKDPISAILETMNNIRKGEQFWIQIVAAPAGHEWTAKAQKAVYKMAGKKSKSESKPGPLSPFLQFFGDWVAYSNTLTRAEKPETKKKDEPLSIMLHMTPGERNAIEAIERKISKIGYDCKIRLVYIAEKDVFNTGRVVPAVFGAMKQFSTNDLNGFKPESHTKTSAYYGFAERKKDKRRGKIVRNYIARSAGLGGPTFILNIEELATIYHFPINTVKTPLLPRLEMKKSEPPSYLPISEQLPNEGSGNQLRQQLDDLQIHNDYYEKKYSLQRDRLIPKETPTKASTSTESSPNNLPIA